MTLGCCLPAQHLVKDTEQGEAEFMSGGGWGLMRASASL